MKPPGILYNTKSGKLIHSKEEKQNYRYVDVNKLENNNMLDCTRAAKYINFRWDIHNTK